ncbi:cytochrome C biogenesis protein, partial [bacterium]|nr:cytochrome C biogenesis protein [bacterium]
MKKISHIFFSMQTMGTLMLIFAFAIGTATFIENDFGPNGAKAVVYNAMWFNVLLILLAINLSGRIILDKLYKPKKFTVFLFHFSFLIILIGAGITRFISFEGVMHIREGDISNSMLTDNTYVELSATKGND